MKNMKTTLKTTEMMKTTTKNKTNKHTPTTKTTKQQQQKQCQQQHLSERPTDQRTDIVSYRVASGRKKNKAVYTTPVACGGSRNKNKFRFDLI